MSSLEIASQRERAAWAQYMATGKTYDLLGWRAALRVYHDELQHRTQLLAESARKKWVCQ